MYKEILDKIIKPQYLKSLSYWQSNASEKEKIGIQIVQQIYKGKGIRNIIYKLPQQKSLYETQFSFLDKKKNIESIEEAEQKFRLKQMTTSYNFFHGGLQAPKQRTEITIFQFKTLKKMNLSRPFTAMTVQYIDNWIELNDNIKYQKVVLSFLRSVNSQVKLNDPTTTQMRTQYDWKNDWNLAKPVRIDKAGENLFAYKPNIQGINKQKQKQKKHLEKLKQLQKTDFAKNIHLYGDFKIK